MKCEICYVQIELPEDIVTIFIGDTSPLTMCKKCYKEDHYKNKDTDLLKLIREYRTINNYITNSERCNIFNKIIIDYYAVCYGAKEWEDTIELHTINQAVTKKLIENMRTTLKKRLKECRKELKELSPSTFKELKNE